MSGDNHYYLWPKGDAALFLAVALILVTYYICDAYIETHSAPKVENHTQR